MGFFGGLGKRLKDGRIADGLAAAQAALGGDYATAQRIQEAGRERRQQARQLDQQKAAIVADTALTPEQRAFFEAYGSLYPHFVIQRWLGGGKGAGIGSTVPSGYGIASPPAEPEGGLMNFGLRTAPCREAY
jgi:hypothetical protein